MTSQKISEQKKETELTTLLKTKKVDELRMLCGSTKIANYRTMNKDCMYNKIYNKLALTDPLYIKEKLINLKMKQIFIIQKKMSQHLNYIEDIANLVIKIDEKDGNKKNLKSGINKRISEKFRRMEKENGINNEENNEENNAGNEFGSEVKNEEKSEYIPIKLAGPKIYEDDSEDEITEESTQESTEESTENATYEDSDEEIRNAEESEIDRHNEIYLNYLSGVNARDNDFTDRNAEKLIKAQELEDRLYPIQTRPTLPRGRRKAIHKRRRARNRILDVIYPEQSRPAIPRRIRRKANERRRRGKRRILSNIDDLEYKMLPNGIEYTQKRTEHVDDNLEYQDLELINTLRKPVDVNSTTMDLAKETMFLLGANYQYMIKNQYCQIIMRFKTFKENFWGIPWFCSSTYRRPGVTLERQIETMWRSILNEKWNFYEDSEWIGMDIRIKFARNVRVLMGASDTIRKKIDENREKYLYISPKSRFNCLYQAVEVARKFHLNKELILNTEQGQEKRVQYGKRLKNLIKKNLISTDKNLKDYYCDEDSLQITADYIRLPIKLYDEAYKIKKIFTPENPLKKSNKRLINEVEILQRGFHAVAIIPKEKIIMKYPDFDFKEFEAKNNKKQLGSEVKDDDSKEGEEDKPRLEVQRKKKFYVRKGSLQDKIATLDIETFLIDGKRHKSYAIGFAYYSEFHHEKRYEYFYGTNCIEEFFEWLYYADIYDGLPKTVNKIFAHNGGKFDVILLLHEYLLKNMGNGEHKFRIITEKCCYYNSRWLNLSIQSLRDKKIKFSIRDSCAIIPGSLEKLCQNYNVEHQKLTETVDHTMINRHNYNNPEIKSNIVKYLKHDCLGLLEVMTAFFNTFDEKFTIKTPIKNSKKFEASPIDVSNCLTSAAIARDIFYKKFYKPEKYPLYTLTDEIDEYIRSGYFGGRTEAFYIGKMRGKIYYFDYTSFYPAMACSDLPYGRPEYMEFKDGKLPENFKGFVNVLARHKKDAIERIKVRKDFAQHIIKKDGKNIFPILENWTKLDAVWYEELDPTRYEYEYISGYKFNTAKWYAELNRRLFEIKLEAGDAGQKAIKSAIKIPLNASYGYPGIKRKNVDKLSIFDSELASVKQVEILEDEKMKNLKQVGQYTFIRYQDNLSASYSNVSISAAISSKSRIKITECFRTITNHGGEVLYADTDSVMFSYNISEKLPETLKRYLTPDGDGKSLGSMKNEIYDELKGNKKYKGVKFDQWVYADTLIINGLKAYSISKMDGAYNMEINKLKGYQKRKGKVTQKMHQQLTEGKPIKQKMEYFSAPKDMWCNFKKDICITMKQQDKQFRQLYTKGDVTETGFITPLVM